ncbi:hypothetical protein [Patulibacter sp.]|uniref:TolB family protein n=1 Tax=Patulibacter sp. TaxID=1912859 RepID=UPI002728C334|nr:hypothetical protein [Patulibacter sp.]MDO9409734.1 hypothetical protein [Patulibacter sp.]
MSSPHHPVLRAAHRRIAAPVALVLVALGATAAPSAADDGWIFSRCQPQLCRVDGDGRHRTTITTDGLNLATYGTPVGSRDGKVLGYDTLTAPLGSPMSAWVVRPAAGTGPQRIDPEGTMVDLAPDGSRALVVQSRWYDRDGGPKICTITTTDGGDRRCLTRTPGVGFSDYAGPDLLLGSYNPLPPTLQFLPEGTSRLDTIVEASASGAVTRTVAALPGYGLVDPELSPDGRWVVATAMQRLGQAGRIAVFDRATGALAHWLSPQFEVGYATDDAPAWSPDGRRIVFHRQDPGYDDALYVIDVDGPIGSERRVGSGTLPVWTDEVLPPGASLRPAGKPQPGPRPQVALSRSRVVVRMPAAGTVRVVLDRAVRRAGGTVWRRQARGSAKAARVGAVRLRVGRLPAGRYRATVTVRRTDRVPTGVVRVVRRLR